MTSAGHVIRVLIADDDDEVLHAMTALLTSHPAFEVVGTAANGRDAVDRGRATRPDVALIDVRMPEGGGVRAALGIAAVSPCTKIIALSAADDRSAVLEMLRAGAKRYIVKGSLPEEILVALQEVANPDAPVG